MIILNDKLSFLSDKLNSDVYNYIVPTLCMGTHPERSCVPN